MRFTESLLMSAKVFAHEAGHNFGAKHSSSTDGLMYSNLSKGGDAFISTSRFSMWKTIEAANCVDQILT
jgi:hypothetical protein